MIFENCFRKIKKTLPKNPFYMEATSKNHSALDLWEGGGGGYRSTRNDNKRLISLKENDNNDK